MVLSVQVVPPSVVAAMNPFPTSSPPTATQSTVVGHETAWGSVPDGYWALTCHSGPPAAPAAV